MKNALTTLLLFSTLLVFSGAYANDSESKYSPTGELRVHFTEGYNDCDGWLDYHSEYMYVIRTAKHCFVEGDPYINSITWKGWGDIEHTELNLNNVYFRKTQLDFHRPEVESDAAIIKVDVNFIGSRKFPNHKPTPGIVEFHDVVDDAQGQNVARVRHERGLGLTTHLKYASVLHAPHTIASGGGSGGMVRLDDGRLGTLVSTETEGQLPFAVVLTFTYGDEYEPANLNQQELLLYAAVSYSLDCSDGVENFLKEGFTHNEFWNICS